MKIWYLYVSLMGVEIIKVSDFIVEPVPRSAIQKFVEKWHYSHSTNGVQHTQCFALFDGMKMIGAMIYALPSMKATAAKYNPINPLRCWELRRLCCIDDTPTNTESYFIGKTLRWLKQNTDIEVIISYADLEQGHEGVIYKASNFHHLGNNGGGRVLMVDGKMFHARSMNQKQKPYGRELKRRWENKEGHKFWDSEEKDMYYQDVKPKNIYVYYLNKKIKKKLLK